jgi:hypothetical protein
MDQVEAQEPTRSKVRLLVYNLCQSLGAIKTSNSLGGFEVLEQTLQSRGVISHAHKKLDVAVESVDDLLNREHTTALGGPRH